MPRNTGWHHQWTSGDAWHDQQDQCVYAQQDLSSRWSQLSHHPTVLHIIDKLTTLQDPSFPLWLLCTTWHGGAWNQTVRESNNKLDGKYSERVQIFQQKLLRITTTMRGARLMEQPLPQCWLTNHVPFSPWPTAAVTTAWPARLKSSSVCHPPILFDQA